MQGDHKNKLPGSSWSVLLPFLVMVFVVLPLWVVVILPLTILFLILGKLKKKCTRSSRPRGSTCIQSPMEKVLEKYGPAPSFDDRKYDLVLFGATGFTGQMAAAYVSKTYGSKISWAIAGRRQSALESLREEIATHYNDDNDAKLHDLPIIIADSFNEAKLADLVKSTRVVCTTVGPFARYGENLVNLCAALGTSYCDITGESDFVRQMIDKYDTMAKKSGAQIVSFCGHDCVPWDLSAMAMNDKLPEGEGLKSAHFYDEIRGAASGGTLETVFESLQNRIKYKAQCGFDPLMCVEGKKSPFKTIISNQSFLGYSMENGTWVVPFIMAMVMANCVRRSNAINQYGKKFVYREAKVVPGFMAGFVEVFGMIIFGCVIVCPPLRYLARRFVLPGPGQGPSEEAMDKGFLHITGYGIGEKGTKVESHIYFPTDPGYRDTARMLVESGLALALDRKKLDVQGGGVFTPASCQRHVLLERLCATGTSFSCQLVEGRKQK